MLLTSSPLSPTPWPLLPSRGRRPLSLFLKPPTELLFSLVPGGRRPLPWSLPPAADVVRFIQPLFSLYPHPLAAMELALAPAYFLFFFLQLALFPAPARRQPAHLPPQAGLAQPLAFSAPAATLGSQGIPVREQQQSV
jgi:hypothetical protein